MARHALKYGELVASAGSLVDAETDALVNAVKESCLEGAGVDALIATQQPRTNFTAWVIEKRACKASDDEKKEMNLVSSTDVAADWTQITTAKGSHHDMCYCQTS